MPNSLVVKWNENASEGAELPSQMKWLRRSSNVGWKCSW